MSVMPSNVATWDPTQYLSFKNQRLRPALELLARVPLAAPERIVDLGCGAGNVTRCLRERWPQAGLVGVDSSAEMLAAARKELPQIEWLRADMAVWEPPQPVDLIYSNAALHWLRNHAVLFPRLLECLRSGGVLAVQMPRNFTAPSHRLMHEAAQAGPWRDKLAHLVTPPPVLEPGAYYDILAPLCKSVDLWETEYHQVLSGENPVAEFTKGSWLKSFLDCLHGQERADFEADYCRRVAAAYPKRAGGQTVFPFKRLFIVAQV
jgi:trans-aconitate 2-methyltransferase